MGVIEKVYFSFMKKTGQTVSIILSPIVYSEQHLVHLVVKSVDRRMKNAAGTTQRRQVRHRVWLNSKEGYYMFVE